MTDKRDAATDRCPFCGAERTEFTGAVRYRCGAQIFASGARIRGIHCEKRIIASLTAERDAALARTTAAEQRVAELERELQRHRREELRSTLARASEDYCCSSWSPSTIDDIRRATEGETVEDWPADGADVTAIRRLRELAGGWWSDAETFVDDGKEVPHASDKAV